MKRYLFHKHIQGEFMQGLDAREFEGFSAACLHAVQFVRDYATRRDVHANDFIQVVDEDGEVLKSIAFFDVLRSNEVEGICKRPPRAA